MRAKLGERLPTFTPAQSAKLVANPPDFFGLNHYTSEYMLAAPTPAGYDQDPGQPAHCALTRQVHEKELLLSK